MAKIPLVVGGVINSGEIGGPLDLQANLRGDLGIRSRGILGGLINTGYIGGGINLKSFAEGDKDKEEGGSEGERRIKEGGGIEGEGGYGDGGNSTSSAAPEKEGYLLKKRSEAKRSFNRRYFVLHGNILVYSESRFVKEPLGVIFLEGHSVELVDERMFAIHFHTAAYTGRSYILQAESEAEAESWMQALAHCGSEFLILSVEELEDALRALNSLADCSEGTSTENPVQCTSVIPTPSSAATVGHRNPFNSPITVPQDHRQRHQKQQLHQHSVEHLAGLLTLSWKGMQNNVREYLDSAVASAEVAEQQHL
ncbi:unnamed protein product [Hydatigera taeniaeformis]|uniref:PH domain-containing protein n=1 Tax=Hydatigena taeniaeformis TaxID=6205 RepID=A0A0R3X984_HYDTA|nr:unnamed protein product [Hydatigera taeniaeformis]